MKNLNIELLKKALEEFKASNTTIFKTEEEFSDHIYQEIVQPIERSEAEKFGFDSFNFTDYANISEFLDTVEDFIRSQSEVEILDCEAETGLGDENSFDVWVEAKSKVTGEVKKFLVQLVNGEFRASLGCLVLEENEGDSFDSPYFSKHNIAMAAEIYAKNQTEEEYVGLSDEGTIYLVDSPKGFTIAIENSNFINSDTNPYEKRFHTETEFSDKDEALEYAKSLTK